MFLPVLIFSSRRFLISEVPLLEEQSSVRTSVLNVDIRTFILTASAVTIGGRT